MMQKIQKFEWIEWQGCKEEYELESTPHMMTLSQDSKLIIRMKTSDGIISLKPSRSQTVEIIGDLARYDKSIESTS